MIGISFIFLALVLGFKHSYDSDHLIAVSSILRKADSVKSSLKSGLSWAAGHMLTATVVTIIIFVFRQTFLNNILPYFEIMIGIMIIALGILSLREFFSLHSHPHLHIKNQEKKHHHRHMFGIGIIQGLASNNELIILFAASLALTSLGGLIAALGFFSLGVVMGMLLFSFAFSYSLIRMHSYRIYRFLSFGTGSIGVIYGSLMLLALA